MALSLCTQLMVYAFVVSLVILAPVLAASPAAHNFDEIARWNHEALLAKKANKNADAEKLLNKVVDAMEKEGGTEVSLADALDNLSIVLLAEGLSTKAQLAQQKSAAIRKKFRLHVLHPAQLQELPETKENRQVVDRMFLEVDQVIDGHDPMVTKLPVEPSVESFNTVQKNSWGLRNSGNPQKAAIGFRISLAIANQLPEKPNSQQVDALGSLAAVYKITGRKMAAVMLYDATIDTEEKIDEKSKLPREKDAKLATILDNAALALSELGDLETTLSLQKEALSIYQNTQQPESMDIGQTTANLSMTYSALGQMEKAEQELNTAIRILGKQYAKDSPEMLIEFDNLASIYFKQKKYDKSEQLRKEVLDGFRKRYRQAHPDLALAVSNLAATYVAEKKYELAEPLFKECIAMDETIFGVGSPKTIEAKANYAAFLKQAGRLDESAKVLQGLKDDGKQIPSSERVLQAINVMMEKPQSPEVDSAVRIVVEFADKSSDVNVLIDPRYIKLPSKNTPEFERSFLAYYIAGSVKYQLEHKSDSKNGLAAVPAAIRSELFIYDQFKKKIPNYRNEFYENLKDIDSKGNLQEYVQKQSKK